MKRFILILIAALLAATTAHAGWWRTFGGIDEDIGYCVQQTSDGGYIIAGVTQSFGRVGERDMWLIKLDSLGHKEWDRTYEPGYARSVRQTSDGGYIIAGDAIIRTDETGEPIWTRDFEERGYCVQITDDNAYIISGSTLWGNLYPDDLWLLKISNSGDSLWSKTYRKGNAWNVGHYVDQTSDGGYIITGEAKYDDPELEEYKFGLWLLKTDSLGDTLWEKTYGGDEWGDLDFGTCVQQTDDNGFIIAGRIGNDILIKTDENGDSTWAKGYGSGGTGRCVKQTPDGGYILTGSIRTVSTSSTLSNWDNLWLVKADVTGDSTWTVNYGNGSDDAGRYVQQTTDSGYIVVGHTASFGAGVYDVYLLKTDSLGLLGITEEPVLDPTRNWQIVASVGSKIVLKFWDKPQGFQALVFDVTGCKVDELGSTGSTGIITWGDAHPPGVYFIREIKTRERATTAKVVLVH